MNVGVLLKELRERDVHLEANGLTLCVDAPTGADTDELRAVLREHKRALIRLLERERRRLEEAGRRGLLVTWAREPGYIALHDPTTGEWHEVLASECLPDIVESARAHHHHRSKAGA